MTVPSCFDDNPVSRQSRLCAELAKESWFVPAVGVLPLLYMATALASPQAQLPHGRA
jgi:hypothetical protein